MAGDLQRNLRGLARLIRVRRVDDKRRGVPEQGCAARRHRLADDAQSRRIAGCRCPLTRGVGRRPRDLDRRNWRGDDVDVGLNDEGLEEDREQRRKGQRRPFDGRAASPTVVASAPPEHGRVIL
mgnify:FL=1